MNTRIDSWRVAKAGSSVIAIAIACSSTAAYAQSPEAASGQNTNADSAIDPVVDQGAQSGDTGEEILVVGARASQQSAINRKRTARTATDSLVADDIGAFPDRNVNEALSRVPGVALGRNDFGEGDAITIRGNGPELTRVELDGLGVQATNGFAENADRGRGADMRELPAALIKSVDVVKGSTADMTEGALGGTVLIKTRTGLDFKKPYFSLDIGGQQNSIGRKVTPQGTVVAASKFLNDRLGVIVSGTYNHIQTNGHTVETTNSRNYNRLFDFDNSPEKTFEFNPDTVQGDAASVVFPNSTETPLSLVTKAAGAQSKAQCFEIFPHASATAATAVRNQRVLEQQSCLNQWNDYTPTLLRSFMNSQEDKRISVDARVDFRVTDDFIVFAKFNQSNRKTDDQNRGRNLVDALIQQNTAGTFQTTATGYPRRRTPNANSASRGYYLYDPDFGLTSAGNNATLGNILNVVPGSVTVDENHNVTQMTLTNNTTNIDQISNVNDTKTRYMQIGGDFNRDRLEINAMAGMVDASSTRADMRTSRRYSYGNATLTLQPNGLWDIDLPETYNEDDPNNYVQLNAPPCIGNGTPPTCVGQEAVTATQDRPASPAYTVGQMPLVTPSFSAAWSPVIAETAEKIAKLDIAYRTEGILPFISRIKAGAMFRNNKLARWGNGGRTVRAAQGTFGQPGYVAPIVLPRAIGRGTFRACQPTPGSSAAGGLPCNYGFVQSTVLGERRQGVDTLTPDELRQLFSDTLEPNDDEFFGDWPKKGDLEPAWQGIRTKELFKRLGNYQFMNFDCVKECVANDGEVYDQPVQLGEETIKNIYFMADFEQDLPMGLRFDGNVGVRGVHTKVDATGTITLNIQRITSAYDPRNPNNAAGLQPVQSYSQNVSYRASTMDWLPTFNANLWGFNDKVVLRFYGGKTISRPNFTRLLPGGNCTIDERNVIDDDDEAMGCGGRIGNPALKPFTAWNYNFSAEWYPNRDTVLSLAYHKLDVKVGGDIGVSVDMNPFTGTEVGDQIDPTTGGKVGDLSFFVPTYENGPGYVTKGLEFQFKTALTFLPWFLRYTGFDFNISTLKSSGSNILDPLTGDVMLPRGESKYYTNLSVWYDDGRLQLRVAYQDRTARFDCITPCGGGTTDINYPGEGYSNVRLVGPGYNPGVPRFNDASSFIDAKASFNITDNFQIYAEGRNLTRTAQSASFGKYTPFADDIPKIQKLSYGGRRFMAGVRVQFGGN